MPLHKVTDFLSEISSFFRKNDAHKAMYSILDVINLNSATHIVRNKFKILSNNILPSILPCQKIHLT